MASAFRTIISVRRMRGFIRVESVSRSQRTFAIPAQADSPIIATIDQSLCVRRHDSNHLMIASFSTAPTATRKDTLATPCRRCFPPRSPGTSEQCSRLVKRTRTDNVDELTRSAIMRAVKNRRVRSTELALRARLARAGSAAGACMRPTCPALLTLYSMSRGSLSSWMGVSGTGAHTAIADRNQTEPIGTPKCSVIARGTQASPSGFGVLGGRCVGFGNVSCTMRRECSPS